MRISKDERENLSPLGRWLLAYTDEQGITLTGLARQAGLSLGSLRYFVKDPDREPRIETCLRLAEVTDKDAEELFEMAGINAPEGAERFRPNRMELLRNYDQLSGNLRALLLTISRELVEAG